MSCCQLFRLGDSAIWEEKGFFFPTPVEVGIESKVLLVEEEWSVRQHLDSWRLGAVLGGRQ